MSRTFGDISSKLDQFGGKPGVVIAEPEIKHFKIFSYYDFIIMGCDGIFDQLTNRDIINTVWSKAKNKIDLMKDKR